MKLILITGFLGALHLCLGANILFLIPLPSKSHYNLGDRLVRELVKRGHKVTLLSPFNMPQPPSGLSEIVIPNVVEKFKTILQQDGKEGSFNLRHMTPLSFLSFNKIGEVIFEGVMEDGKIREFLKSNQKFDLIIGECFLADGMIAGFSLKHNAPMVGIATFLPNTWSNSLVGNPAPASYVPEPILPYTNKMTFLQRCNNLFYGILAGLSYHYYQLPSQDRMMRKYFGNDLPPLSQVISNTSLVLVNHHYSLAFPRPYLPNMIEVGGYHVKPLQPLPKDLKSFMDEAKDGVILFSMGSNLHSSDFPEEKIAEILKAFSKLKQRVLWKFEKENLPNLPKNVKISKWLPQSDILGHPNVKLFISHGGILSITESVLRGVPLVAIPIFGDQSSNVNFIAELEMGVRLEYENINEASLTQAINQVLSDPKYGKNAKYRSIVLQDVPVPQLDHAIYWIEYVIRHNGAFHLRSSAQDLSWYQLYLLDVIGFLVLVCCLPIIAFYQAAKRLKRCLWKKERVTVTSQSKKKN